jgi:choice-of-anchor B domain-containing protein
MYDFQTHKELGSNGGEGSGSWGWTYRGREFIALGQTDGASFAEVTKKGELVYLGRLPAQASPVIWREIKVLKDFLIVGSEGVGHGIQIFDLKKLLKINPKNPVTFNTSTDLVGLFTDLPVGRSHNVVVNEEKGYVVAVGAAPRNTSCGGGLIFIDMTNPAKPTSPGCAPQDGYVHDAQCIVYRGPHKKYYGRDICYGYNEDTLTIYDVTNKKGPQAASIISRTPYAGASYTHQGWIIDPNWQTHLVLDDELDEGVLDPNRTSPDSPAKDGFPVTYIFDITNLEKPKNTGYYKSSVQSVDHNQFIHNGLSYQSNYQAGLRILDISSIPYQPTGKGVKEIAYFDVYPGDDDLPGGGEAVWDAGTWSHYTFPSGFIVVNTIDRGAFVVKINLFKGQGYGKRHVKGPR